MQIVCKKPFVKVSLNIFFTGIYSVTLYDKLLFVMKKFIQNCSVILVLLVFLISTNGMSIYHHLCACKKATYYSLAATMDCNNGTHQKTDCSKECCTHSKVPKIAHHKSYTLAGCSTEEFFYKIPSVNNTDHSKISFKAFTSDIPSFFIPAPEIVSVNTGFAHFKEKPPLISDIIISQHILII